MKKVGDQRTLITCKPGMEKMRAVQYLVKSKGETKGEETSGFKSNLATRLHGSTSLLKSEEELLEGKKKKVQLGRVLDDEPKAKQEETKPAPGKVAIPPGLVIQIGRAHV